MLGYGTNYFRNFSSFFLPLILKNNLFHMFQLYSENQTMATAITRSRDDSEFEWSSEDEWEDSEPSEPLQTRNPTKIEDALVPSWTQDKLESLPIQLTLINYVEDETGYALFRCEPANKCYPGIAFGATSVGQVHLTVHLLNSTSHVQMRTPDIKTKRLPHTRVQNGLVFGTKGSIHFKKKCLDKQTKKDIAFELGKSYLSHTGGITPQFVFVAVPFENGSYVKSKAFRSPAFRVFSKRQERFLEHIQKRQKKNVEIEKLDTDILDAETTLRCLAQELQRQTFMDHEMVKFFNEIRSNVDRITDPTAKTALQYALRHIESSEVANL